MQDNKSPMPTSTFFGSATQLTVCRSGVAEIFRVFMRLPELLRPTATVEFRVSDSHTVLVPMTVVQFQPWCGPPIADDYGGKAVLNYLDDPLFAELVILRHFEAAGWQGVWIDTYRRRTRVSLAKDLELPPARRDLLNRVSEQAGTSHGCFDVYAWNDSGVMFAEAKRRGRDRIRSSQADGFERPSRSVCHSIRFLWLSGSTSAERSN